ncbi:MAG: SpoIIE family protein phosphatase [candidate division Zixibacteria bacterium]|nr:SpoIIE family protein phosphatase [candidate division Zixibacteria bacterium]
MKLLIYGSPTVSILIIFGIAAIFITLSLDSDFLILPEKYLDDIWYAVHSETRVNDNIVIVEIDDRTLEYYFPEIPLPRSQIALLINDLADPSLSVRTIVLDLYFEGPSKKDPGDDTLLAHIMATHKNKIICATFFPDFQVQEASYAGNHNPLEKFSYPLDYHDFFDMDYVNTILPLFLNNIEFLGHINVYQDETNVIRELPLMISFKNSIVAALSIEALRCYLRLPRGEVFFKDKKLYLKDREIPVDKYGTFKIRYFKSPSSYTRYSFIDLMEKFSENEIYRASFKDKIVIIGINSKTYYPKEISFTPFGEERPNVYLHADIISNILHESYLANPHPLAVPITLLLMGFVFSFIQPLKSRTYRLVISLVLMFLILAADYILFQSGYVFQCSVLILAGLPMAVYTYLLSFKEQVEIIRTQEQEKLILKEKEKSLTEIEEEIKVARAIQEYLLPAQPPSIPHYDIFGLNIPARGVSGDFYDFVKLSETELAITIADISGKGISASLLMTASQAVMRSESNKFNPGKFDCADIVAGANRLIHAITDPSRFLTLFYAILDYEQNTFCFVNAGHNSPIAVGPASEIEYLENGGLILGIMPETEYRSETLKIVPGQKLILYTDGVVEAEKANAEQYGEERLANLVKDNVSLSSRQLAEKLIDDIHLFTEGYEQSDDITIIIIGRDA